MPSNPEDFVNNGTTEETTDAGGKAYAKESPAGFIVKGVTDESRTAFDRYVEANQ